MLKRMIGIDLGTSNISIYRGKKGLVVREPSVVAFDKTTNKYVAFGRNAKKLYGKVSNQIEIIHPIRHGVIADFEATDQLIQYYLKKMKMHFCFLKPKVVMSLPLERTKVEESSFREVVERMGVYDVHFIESVKAAAIGAGLDLQKPVSQMIVHIGSERTDLAILSSSEIIMQQTTSIAGHLWDERIVAYLRDHYKLWIGKNLAEKIKIEGTSLDRVKKEIEVSGKDIITGLPHTVVVTSDDIQKAIQGDIFDLVELIKDMLSDVHPEIASDIALLGITLTGGSAQLEGLAEFLSSELGIPVKSASDSGRAVIDGIGILLENPKLLKVK